MYKGLKTNIVFSLIFLLSLAMLLINVVMISMARNELIRSEAEKGRIVLRGVAERLNGRPSVSAGEEVFQIDNLLKAHEQGVFACLQRFNADGRLVATGQEECLLADTIQVQAQKSLLGSKETASLHGSIFAAFWRQQGHLLLTQPILKNGQNIGVFGAAIDLKDVHENIRQTQRIFFLYFVANLIILVLFGFFWLYRIMVRPVQRLSYLIEGFRDTEDFLLPTAKNDTEFQKLNRSLQRMVRRFSRNREELRETVCSLEKSNQELKEAQTEIIRAEKLASVGRLSAGIAHEIGNPIGIVLGYFELLQQNGLAEKDRQDFLARAEKEVNRINLIIRQLLDLSRASSDGMQTVSIHSLLNDLDQVVSVQPLMAKFNFTLELKAENEQVLVDGNQLRQVFLNLIINAADALESSDLNEKGKLTIKTANITSADKDENFLTVSFVDNGPGISKDMLDNIFDPFFTTKEPGKGTGLGLAVSFMIIESFNGSIEVQSDEGKGTTMTVLLPLV